MGAEERGLLRAHSRGLRATASEVPLRRFRNTCSIRSYFRSDLRIRLRRDAQAYAGDPDDHAAARRQTMELGVELRRTATLRARRTPRTEGSVTLGPDRREGCGPRARYATSNPGRASGYRRPLVTPPRRGRRAPRGRGRRAGATPHSPCAPRGSGCRSGCRTAQRVRRARRDRGRAERRRAGGRRP